MGGANPNTNVTPNLAAAPGMGEEAIVAIPDPTNDGVFMKCANAKVEANGENLYDYSFNGAMTDNDGNPFNGGHCDIFAYLRIVNAKTKEYKDAPVDPNCNVVVNFPSDAPPKIDFYLLKVPVESVTLSEGQFTACPEPCAPPDSWKKADLKPGVDCHKIFEEISAMTSDHLKKI